MLILSLAPAQEALQSEAWSCLRGGRDIFPAPEQLQGGLLLVGLEHTALSFTHSRWALFVHHFRASAASSGRGP